MLNMSFSRRALRERGESPAEHKLRGDPWPCRPLAEGRARGSSQPLPCLCHLVAPQRGALSAPAPSCGPRDALSWLPRARAELGSATRWEQNLREQRGPRAGRGARMPSGLAREGFSFQTRAQRQRRLSPIGNWCSWALSHRFSA